jgi:hypothetical protein
VAPGDDCPIFRAFLRQVAGDDEERRSAPPRNAPRHSPGHARIAEAVLQVEPPAAAGTARGVGLPVARRAQRLDVLRVGDDLRGDEAAHAVGVCQAVVKLPPLLTVLSRSASVIEDDAPNESLWRLASAA